jgi:hypothetical protein
VLTDSRLEGGRGSGLVVTGLSRCPNHFARDLRRSTKEEKEETVFFHLCRSCDVTSYLFNFLLSKYKSFILSFNCNMQYFPWPVPVFVLRKTLSPESKRNLRRQKMRIL